MRRLLILNNFASSLVPVQQRRCIVREAWRLPSSSTAETSSVSAPDFSDAFDKTVTCWMVGLGIWSQSEAGDAFWFTVGWEATEGADCPLATRKHQHW